MKTDYSVSIVAIVDGKPYACHMAIADRWDIWYLNAYMAFSEEKRAEEAAFMRDFDVAFAARHRDALAGDEQACRARLFHRRLRREQTWRPP